MTTPIKKSTKCSCGKNGLYRVGDFYYCSDHRQDGVERLKKFGNPKKPKNTQTTNIQRVTLIHVDRPSKKQRLIQRRNELAANPTPAELVLRELLSKDWIFQQILYGYIPDFLHRKGKLIIELDGKHHFTASGRRADSLRTWHLSNKGYRVIRFPNRRVIEEPSKVMDEIQAAMKECGL